MRYQLSRLSAVHSGKSNAEHENGKNETKAKPLSKESQRTVK